LPPSAVAGIDVRIEAATKPGERENRNRAAPYRRMDSILSAVSGGRSLPLVADDKSGIGSR
jgi:hypothetical protein